MAERIGKHCWATPKCGITTCIELFRDFKIPLDYRFIVVRNPYRRMVSFYTSTVVDAGPEYLWEDGKVVPQPPYLHTAGFKYSREMYAIPHLRAGHLSWSFEALVNFLSDKEPVRLDRHLKPQSVRVNPEINSNIIKRMHPEMFNRIVRLENWQNDMKLICKEMGLDESITKRILDTKRSETKAKKNPSIQDKVWNKPAQWFLKNGIPKDWRLFYNQHIEEIVYRLYKKDFEMWGYEREKF